MLDALSEDHLNDVWSNVAALITGVRPRLMPDRAARDPGGQPGGRGGKTRGSTPRLGDRAPKYTHTRMRTHAPDGATFLALAWPRLHRGRCGGKQAARSVVHRSSGGAGGVRGHHLPVVHHPERGDGQGAWAARGRPTRLVVKRSRKQVEEPGGTWWNQWVTRAWKRGGTRWNRVEPGAGCCSPPEMQSASRLSGGNSGGAQVQQECSCASQKVPPRGSTMWCTVPPRGAPGPGRSRGGWGLPASAHASVRRMRTQWTRAQGAPQLPGARARAPSRRLRAGGGVDCA